MQIETRSAQTFVTNTSADSTTAGTSIANPATTRTAPSGDGVIAMGAGGGIAANSVLLLPFGTDTNDQTFLMSVFGWEHVIPKGQDSTQLWVAFPLCTFSCTLSTVAGVDGTFVDSSHLFVDLITLVAGNANVSVEIVSPGTDILAHVVVDAKGCKYLSVLFARNSSAASMNALCRRL